MLWASHRSFANSSSTCSDTESAAVPSINFRELDSMITFPSRRCFEANLLLCLFPRSSECFLRGMHIGLIRLLERSMTSSHLQQFRGPPQFSKRRQHRVTEHVWSHRAYPCFFSQKALRRAWEQTQEQIRLKTSPGGEGNHGI